MYLVHVGLQSQIETNYYYIGIIFMMYRVYFMRIIKYIVYYMY